MSTEKGDVPQDPEDVRSVVRKGYSEVARRGSSCCCGPDTAMREHAEGIGYDREDLEKVPDGANLGLGCGNPTALASLKPGEVVVDLGAGAGLDAFIAAGRVGPTGRVIGVDMTPEMLEKGRTHAVEAGLSGIVEFREGIIEDLPVVSESADVVISNCVINLSPDKPRVFAEAFRVLKPGGRLAVSDILLTEPLPQEVTKAISAYVGCLGGAWVAGDYLAAVEEAGFVDVRWTRRSAADLFDGGSGDPATREIVALIGEDRAKSLRDTIWSYQIEASKA